MRLSLSLSLALSLLAVPAARAEVAPPATPSIPVVAVQPAVAGMAPQVPGMKLREVRVPARSHDRSSAAGTFQRGSFWWTVGVIVVAGVILAILL